MLRRLLSMIAVMPRPPGASALAFRAEGQLLAVLHIPKAAGSSLLAEARRMPGYGLQSGSVPPLELRMLLPRHVSLRHIPRHHAAVASCSHSLSVPLQRQLHLGAAKLEGVRKDAPFGDEDARHWRERRMA